MKLLLIIALAIGAASTAPLEENIDEMLRDLSADYRLNDDVLPSQYNITLTPYFEAKNNKEAFTFDGVAVITVKTSKADVQQIVLHVNDLVVDEAQTTLALSTDAGARIAVTASHNATTHKYTLNLASAMRQNIEYVLSFTYVGYMRDDMHGFYRSSYVQNGVTK